MSDLNPKDIVTYVEERLARELTEQEIISLQKSYITELEKDNAKSHAVKMILAKEILDWRIASLLLVVALIIILLWR